MNLQIISLRLSEIKVDFSLSSRMAFFDGKIAPISGIDIGAIRSRFCGRSFQRGYFRRSPNTVLNRDIMLCRSVSDWLPKPVTLSPALTRFDILADSAK